MSRRRINGAGFAYFRWRCLIAMPMTVAHAHWLVSQVMTDRERDGFDYVRRRR